MHVLVIEDDPDTARHVSAGLEGHDHTVAVAADGETGLDMARSGQFDVLVVDRLLPGMDGLSLVRALRADGRRTPALILSTLDGIDDRVTGLEAGGDDYLVKPFAMRELAARVAALHRRVDLRATRLLVGDLELDLLARKARRGERRIELQPREFRLLEFLMRHAGEVVTRRMLLERVWNFHFDPQTTVVETHLSRLRDKIEAGEEARLLHTIRGAGYCLRAPG